MPSHHDLFILPTTELPFSTKMNTHISNEKKLQLNPQDILQNQAEKWQISITSEEFARKLDETDSLRHMRDEFYYPKNGTLPKGNVKYHISFSI